MFDIGQEDLQRYAAFELLPSLQQIRTNYSISEVGAVFVAGLEFALKKSRGLSRYPVDMPASARKEVMRQFQKFLRAGCNHVAVRSALDGDDLSKLLKKDSFFLVPEINYRDDGVFIPNKSRSIEEATYKLLEEKFGFEQIGECVMQGAINYNRKKPVPHSNFAWNLPLEYACIHSELQ
jgi:hypothetical protein